jgi:streptogramin lyase
MRMPRMALVALVALLVAGCAAGSDETASTSTSTSTEGEAREPALPEPITAEGAERVRLDDVLQRELGISDEPDWMVEAFGSLWTIRGTGDVIRVDPDAGKVVAEISPPGDFAAPLCQGIGASEDAIWACPARGDPEGRVVRIDPATNEVVSTLKTHKMPDQGRLISAAGKLWLLGEGGDHLIGVDLETEQAAAEIKLGETCTDLAGGSESVLFVVCPVDGHVLRVDPQAAKIIGKGDFPGARTAWFNGDLWVGFASGTAQADAKSLEIQAVYDTYPFDDGRVYATEDEVFTREGEGANFLTRIDPHSQRITEIVEDPKASSGGDVIVVGDSIWTTTYDDSVMDELER